MNYKINTDKTAAVATDIFWQPIDEHTPIGVKMLLINETYGVAVLSPYVGNAKVFTHWAPLPKFKKEPDYAT